ncbi:phosphodiester glycosidase family protein [Paenibacillus sp. JX-17]|uniref:Phosphodiester glycosidase family protein n=1 Tax=Paenibacillus lacisoli TaxID=3064525 RepID=A0ABT9C9U5_9BACL|nr:phosphodiester glycosidase family protein [Paenibacillus sp. JX-17]MDO7905650.1 phosphodiester glycosidase family protein [Paenibacillus sp. JX-17]
MSPSSPPQRSSARAGKGPGGRHTHSSRKKNKKKKSLRWMLNLILLLLVIMAGTAVWMSETPSGSHFRYSVADTLITTQHRRWAKYILGQEGLDRRIAEYNERFNQMGTEKDTHQIQIPGAVQTAAGKKDLVEIEEVSGKGYHGYIMTVNDPKSIRLGIPGKAGKGEHVSSMAKRLGAVAGVNGGGFADPNWSGNGFKPIGVVISQGQLYYNGLDGKKSTQIVGIDKQGKMIAGNYTLSELSKLQVQEAVTFQPRLIVNGKGLIRSASEGWGIAPRTAMGQRADGAILFVVIDGRQPGYSIGANLYDIQNILLKHGAVIAANLDGGSSSVLVKDNEIVNRPSSEYGERYLPTAFLVFEHPEDIQIPNIWSGMRSQDIDPAKK